MHRTSLLFLEKQNTLLYYYKTLTQPSTIHNRYKKIKIGFKLILLVKITILNTHSTYFILFSNSMVLIYVNKLVGKYVCL